MSLSSLSAQMKRTFEHRQAGSAGVPGSFYVLCGHERATDPRRYMWDGLERASDPDRPQVIVQYTLAGHGAYEQAGRRWDLVPQHCFLAVVPSPHRYFLPQTSGGWTFFYFVVLHDYAVTRLTNIHRRFGPVQKIAHDSILVSRMASLFTSVCAASFRDELAVEQSLLEMVLEYERHAQSGFYPTHRQQLLDETRTWAMAHLSRHIDVAELASSSGMSRSHYSHYFRKTTGISPARYLTDIRLQEVARQLTQTTQTLKHIAAECGFADANHLCKVFRRYFRTSPGEFRQRLR